MGWADSYLQKSVDIILCSYNGRMGIFCFLDFVLFGWCLENLGRGSVLFCRHELYPRLCFTWDVGRPNPVLWLRGLYKGMIKLEDYFFGYQIYQKKFQKYDDHARNLAATVGGVTTWVLYLYWLHKKKFYVALWRINHFF